MISACIPLSLKYSAIEHPAYGAKNCNGADSDAVEAITVVAKKPDNKGRGKIFVLPIEQCIRIRTDERGPDAIG